MDRLTHTNKGMTWYKSELLLLDPSEMSFSQISEVLERLAAYEDTGLTPEELNRIKATTELRIEMAHTDEKLEELRRMAEQNSTLRVLMEAGV